VLTSSSRCGRSERSCPNSERDVARASLRARPYLSVTFPGTATSFRHGVVKARCVAQDLRIHALVMESIRVPELDRMLGDADVADVQFADSAFDLSAP
jgi:hypothetical protein